MVSAPSYAAAPTVRPRCAAPSPQFLSVRSPEGHHRGIPILMEACTIAIKEKYPEAHSIKWRKDLRSRAELVSAICICLEQTFSEAHAEGIQVASAFSKAFDAYHGSALQTTVDGELAVLPWPSVNKIPAEWYSSDLHRNMIEIITTHPLRINSPAA
ncbi:hypothetical protein DFH09DRAFT_1125721 [Mycena vulgaris]|nr:hypothetical protein DFH09DRAFT_1125721 [Mycena vulgaris]